MKNLQNVKVGHVTQIMSHFDLLFCLFFYSLQSVYVLNKTPVALAVLEINSYPQIQNVDICPSFRPQ